MPALKRYRRDNGETMEQSEREELFKRYQIVSTLPMLTVGFLFIAAFTASLVDSQPITRTIFWATWAIFLVDYAIQLILAPRRLRFAATHVLYLVALFFPPLRVWLLILISFRLFMNKSSSLRDRIGMIAGFSVVVIVIFGALLTLLFEFEDPNANIKTFGEGLWWAAVTVTTVGYGDFVPVTVGGRIMGTLVFSIGVGAIAVLTATVIGAFTDSRQGTNAKRSSRRADSDSEDTGIKDVMAKLEEINTRLIELEGSSGTHAGAASRKLSVPRRTVLKTVRRESEALESDVPDNGNDESTVSDSIEPKKDTNDADPK